MDILTEWTSVCLLHHALERAECLKAEAESVALFAMEGALREKHAVEAQEEKKNRVKKEVKSILQQQRFSISKAEVLMYRAAKLTQME